MIATPIEYGNAVREDITTIINRAYATWRDENNVLCVGYKTVDGVYAAQELLRNAGKTVSSVCCGRGLYYVRVY